MNVGMIGLGKLGLPVAYAMASRGLDVYGYDPVVWQAPRDTGHEDDLAEAINAAERRMHFCSMPDVVANCDVVFVAVQTPHEPRFEGVTPLPEDRADFDYMFLRRAVEQLSALAVKQGRAITLAVISTVLPGTMRREIRPLLAPDVRLVYNPSFIAMGSTIRDFLDPEFVLHGGDEYGEVEAVYQLALGSWSDPTFVRTSVENAELIKVAYNTFIGLKIAFANTLMEVCHKTEGADVDEVTGALKLARRRLISDAYLDGGMGDGGGCHPRDNIALSWLARELGLSYDLFGAAMESREAQAEWLCDLMCDHDLPKGILGTAYKPGSSLTAGSPARLVENLLRARGHFPVTIDPHVSPDDPTGVVEWGPRVWLVGCRHPEFPSLELPAGSIVIDPWRYMPDQPGVEVIRVGSDRLGAPAGGRHRIPVAGGRR